MPDVFDILPLAITVPFLFLRTMYIRETSFVVISSRTVIIYHL